MPAPAQTSATPGRGHGCELWLLRSPDEAAPGTPQRTRADLVAAFGGLRIDHVLSGAAEDFGRDLARGLDCPFQLLDGQLPDGQLLDGASADERWARLVDELSQGPRRLLVVLSGEHVQATVARALGIPSERTSALRIDPGRLVLLRDDPHGLVLRRSNVHAPERDPGTQLPWSAAASPEETRAEGRGA